MATHALSTPAREPSVVIATVTGLAAAVITLLVAFNVPLSDDQQKALLGIVAVLAPIIAGLLTRPRVTPNAKVVEFVDTGSEPDTVVAGEASPFPTGAVIGARGLNP